MFADYTNLFYSHQDINTLFSTVNVELEKIEQWFKANRLSLNIKKTKYTSFHKNSSNDDISLKLPDLKIEDLNIERNSSIKVLGIMPAEHINWRDHVKTVEFKIAESSRLLHLARQVLNEASIKTIYFSYSHSYLNYSNIAWASTNVTKRYDPFAAKAICTHCLKR